MTSCHLRFFAQSLVTADLCLLSAFVTRAPWYLIPERALSIYVPPAYPPNQLNSAGGCKNMDGSTDSDTCCICRSEVELKPVPKGRDSYHLSCLQCGEFKITDSAVFTLSEYTSPEDVIKFSGWILHKNRKDEIPTLHTNTLEHIASLPIPGREERMMSLLIELVSIRNEVGTMINVTSEPRLLAATYTLQGGSQGHAEIMGLARMLEDKGLVKVPEDVYGYVRVTSAGYTVVDRLMEPQPKKRPLGFQLPSAPRHSY